MIDQISADTVDGDTSNTIQAKNGGALLAASHAKINGTTIWTGVTEDYDANNENASDSSAMYLPIEDEAARTVSSVHSSATGDGVVICASFA
jgi:hypothetical protein